MKSIIVLSDTHGNLGAVESLFPLMKENDVTIHLGDYHSDVMPFSGELKELYAVKGNCDGGSEEMLIDIDGLKIFLTHGNAYGVKNSLLKLYLRAKELKADAVFYGHTHVADITVKGGITLINPGNMTRYGEKSYCYAAVHNGKITAKIVKIN